MVHTNSRTLLRIETNLVIARWARIVVASVAVWVMGCCSIHAAELDDVDYEQEIKSVLKNKCFSCHGALEQEAGLRLDTGQFMLEGGDSGPAMVRGDAQASLLIERITAIDPFDRMPPEGEPVSPEQIERFLAWIEEGAPFPESEVPQQDPSEHWAFQPLNADRFDKNSSVDGFVDSRLDQAGLHRAEEADRRTLIRRLYLDMHGLPPTREQIDAFIKDESANAWESLVEQVLESPRYGERWAQHWLDVVRYADTHGYEVNTPRPNAWPYRDYVIEAFNQDKSYDEFIFEQLAGDTIGEDAATGFLVAAPVLLPGQIGADDASKRLARQDALDEIIVGTGSTFLGLTIGCARCHDHKFDPISQDDYYAFQAFFAGVEYGDRPLKDDETKRRIEEANSMAPRIDELESLLRDFEPTSYVGRTLIIDDEDDSHVTHLKQKNGHGTNPAGNGRGLLGDVGDAKRMNNISGGRYTWWDNVAGADTFTWNPKIEGRFRLWISWGVHGSGVHTRDARYVLDHDGDLETRDDQIEIAQTDQYYFVGVTEGETAKQPMWSGLLNTGVYDLSESSRIVLRGGETGTGITADVIVLQEVGHDSDNENGKTSSTENRLPNLRAPVNARHNVERFVAREARFVRLTSFETENNSFREPCIDELEVYRAGDHSINVALNSFGSIPSSSGNYSDIGIHQLKHVNDGKYGNSHSWISNQQGGGWVQIEFPDVETIDRIEWGRDREGKFADRLALQYRIDISIDGERWERVAGSEDRVRFGTPFDSIQAIRRGGNADPSRDLVELSEELTSLSERRQRLLVPRMVYGGVFRAPDETFVLHRGDPEQKARSIGPRYPSALAGPEVSENLEDQERRRALAEWIANPQNPLTARVMVNRIWQYHFGTGLVETPSDFGLNGARPSHPDLLDWLSDQFIQSNWSVKSIHRLVLNSETYRQSNRIDVRAAAVDGDCRLLWRFPSRRLEGEAIRDGILATSGQINLEVGGPGFDFFKTRGGLSGFPPVDEFGPEQLRRMIYAHKIRMESVPVFGAFDCPDAGQSMPKRSSSTTAIQALNLFNSPFVNEQAERFAERVKESAPDQIDLQVQRVFEIALGREPTSTEAEHCEQVAREHGLATVCRVIYNTNEFLFMP